jgi:hypothetical protein
METKDCSLVCDLLHNLRSCNMLTLDISLLWHLKFRNDSDKSYA